MMSPAAKTLILNEEVWRIIEEEELKPVEAKLFSKAEKGQEVLVVPSFDGNKSWRESLDWLYRFSQWANQEGLSDDKALVYALLHMKQKAGRWSQQFPRSGSWSDFLKGFFERYIPAVDCSWFLDWYRKDKNKVQIVWYTAREVSKGTNYFSESNCIGEDALGKTYKGCLPGDNNNLLWFAVKKYKKEVKTDSLINVIKEIRSNKDLLAIGHPNVLKLLGFAFSEKAPLLMYDLVPNGTLEMHLQRTRELFWGSRLTVAIDLADAIRHLHSSNYSQTPICKRDVSSYNVLLDHDCRAKLGEYGIELKPTRESSRSPPNSTLKAGVHKVVDPLKLNSTSVGTKKTDVYRYGAILMELISGRKAWVREVSEDLFPDLWQMKRESGKLDEILDPYIRSSGRPCMDAFQEVIFLAVKCCSMRVDAKQTMATVAAELRGILRKAVGLEIERVAKMWREAIERPQPGSLDSCMRLVEKLERVLEHPSLKSDAARLLYPFKSFKSSLLESLRVDHPQDEDPKPPNSPPPVKTPPPAPATKGYRLDAQPPRRYGFDGGPITPRPSFLDGPMTRAPPPHFTDEINKRLKQLIR